MSCHLRHDLAVLQTTDTNLCAVHQHCKRSHHAALQVGDKLYAQMPGAAGTIASPVIAIANVIEHSAFNLQTLRGEGCCTDDRRDAVHSGMHCR